MATTYSWSYDEDARPTLDNPHGGKRRKADGDGDSTSGDDCPRINNTTHLPTTKRVRTNPKARLYVRGLPLQVAEREIGDFFGCFGRVTEIRLMRDRKTEVSRGFAFVNYHDEKDAQKARNHCANGSGRIKDQKIFCDWANKRRPREERRPRESTADKLRRTGLRWEYRWISEQELEEFRAQKEEEQEEAEETVMAEALAADADAGVGGAFERAHMSVAGAGVGVGAPPPPSGSGSLGGLVAYGSDSDTDEDADDKHGDNVTDDDNNDDDDDGDDDERLPPPGPPPKIEGPYATQTMIEWQDQGFFVSGQVLVRQHGDGPDDWDEIGELDFSNFP